MSATTTNSGNKPQLGEAGECGPFEMSQTRPLAKGCGDIANNNQETNKSDSSGVQLEDAHRNRTKNQETKTKVAEQTNLKWDAVGC
jgi:hypothetical protein